ncbi:MAG: hypothetical protein IKV40_00425 [Clostridia bacterium]|nr:hypothetical protein [Clostridia bacterium]
MKKIIIFVLAALMVLPLVSCGTSDWSSYLAEDTVSHVEEGSDPWREIEDMLHALSVDSANLPEFDSEREAIELFRDSTLNYMCCKSYRKYAGHSDKLSAIETEVVGGEAIAAIPAAEFESLMYKYFGGKVKLTHKSTDLFNYMKEEKVYVPVTAPVVGGYDVKVTSVEETENTYRVSFECTADEFSAEYFALLIKREDGSKYFSLLMHR